MVSPGYFRLFLAALVFLQHSTGVHLGNAAVLIFFTLSGYWIHRIWHVEYKQCASPYLTFLISRVWRLLPVFIINVALFVAIFLALKPFPAVSSIWSLAHFLVSHLAILGYARLDQDIFLIVPAWSLDMELQFYIVAPLLISILAAHSFGARGAKYLIVLISFVGLALGMSKYAADFEILNPPNLTNYLVFFLIGVASADQSWKPSRRLALLSAGAFFIFVAGHIAFPETPGLLFRGIRIEGNVLNSLYDVIIAIMAAPLAIATCNIKSSKLDRHSGNLSYVLYLNHWIGAFVLATLFGHLSALERLPYITATWIAVFAASILIYFAVDRPSELLRRRFIHTRKAKGT